MLQRWGLRTQVDFIFYLLSFPSWYSVLSSKKWWSCYDSHIYFSSPSTSSEPTHLPNCLLGFSTWNINLRLKLNTSDLKVYPFTQMLRNKILEKTFKSFSILSLIHQQGLSAMFSKRCTLNPVVLTSYVTADSVEATVPFCPHFCCNYSSIPVSLTHFSNLFSTQ